RYDQIISEISRFLRGGYGEIKNELKEKMEIESEALRFERAQELRDQMNAIEAVMEQQKVSLNEKTDIDIFGYSYNKKWMCIQVYYVRLSKLLERDMWIFPIYTYARDD